MPCYILRAGENGPVKIGFTSRQEPYRVAKRISGIQTGNHELISIVRILEGGADLERALFVRFAHLHLHRSWYLYDDAMCGDLGAPDWHKRDLIYWPCTIAETNSRRWATRRMRFPDLQRTAA